MFDEQKDETNKNVVMNPASSADDDNKGLAGVIEGQGITKMQDINKSTSVKDIQVHTMPGKFLPDTPAGNKKMGSGKKIVLMVIVLVLFLIVIIAGGVWFINQQKQAADTNDNQLAMTNESTNTNTNTNENVNTNTNTNENMNSNVNENVNTNTNTNENVNTNTNINEPLPELPMQELDADGDGLSYEEENLYGTSPESADTDHDGYTDGSELVNLYDPLVPVQALVDSGLVAVFINDDYKYHILKPTAWLARTLADQSNYIIILPDAETGESFSIIVSPNEENLSLVEAATQFSSSLGEKKDFNNFSLGGQPALRSTDSLIAVMINGDYIYIVRYETSVATDNRYFATTFDMVLNSFGLLE